MESLYILFLLFWGSIFGEIYGYSYARFTMIVSAFFQALFILNSLLMVVMSSAQFFHNSACYKSVLIPQVRYFAFAVLGIFFSEILNVFLLVKWKVIRCRTSYLTRAIVCALASQFILSLIVNIGAFSGKTEDFRVVF